jgi:hypothetical protein
MWKCRERAKKLEAVFCCSLYFVMEFCSEFSFRKWLACACVKCFFHKLRGFSSSWDSLRPSCSLSIPLACVQCIRTPSSRYAMPRNMCYYYYSSSGITVLGGPQPLSKLFSTALGPVPYACNSLRPSSLGLFQLTPATLPWVFRHFECALVCTMLTFCSCILKRCPSHLSLPVLVTLTVRFAVQLVKLVTISYSPDAVLINWAIDPS